MNKLGEVNFENRPSRFPAFVEDVRKICGIKEIVFGLEDTRGFGRNLAAYLVGRKFEVKHVNPAYTSTVRLANPIIYKDDSYDAYCVARVLRDMGLSPGPSMRIYLDNTANGEKTGFACKEQCDEQEPAPQPACL
jgi:hypothetical protein